MPVPEHAKQYNHANVDNAVALVSETFEDVTSAEVTPPLNATPIDPEFDIERGKLSVEIWDRVSSINGCPAEQILARGDIPATGDVVLLRTNGVITHIQPFDHTGTSPKAIAKGTGLAFGRRFADEVATETAASTVLRRVQAKVEENRAQL